MRVQNTPAGKHTHTCTHSERKIQRVEFWRETEKLEVDDGVDVSYIILVLVSFGLEGLL